MATTPSPAIQLYLYRLLIRAFGTGRQVFLPKVEEAFAADGLEAADLGCTDVREVLSLLDFVALTDFKGGRTYVSLSARADFDEALAALDADVDDPKPAKNGKPWKKRRTTLKPQRPRRAKAAAKKEAAKEEAPEQETAKEEAPTAETSADGAAAQGAPEEVAPADGAPAATPAADDAPTPAPLEEADSDESPNAAPVARTLAEILAEARAEDARLAAELEQFAAEQAALELEERNAAKSSDPGTGEAEAAQAQTASSAAQEAPTPPSATRSLPRSLPVSFWDDVLCPDDMLAALTQQLPFDADAHRALEEGWRISRATGTLQHDRTSATFDLRYLRQDGTPISVGISRRSGGKGKRWQVSSIVGDKDDAPATFEEARVASEGAWVELSAYRLAPYLRRKLLDELAQAVFLGSWNDFCALVADAAQPEPWGFASEDNYSLLREYLLVNLTRALEQQRFAETPDGAALWNTGLVTEAGRALCCLFGLPNADGTRSFVAVCAQDDPRLASYELPQPASFIESLDELLIRRDATLQISPDAHVSERLAQRTLATVQANWRAVVPVWDPQERRQILLLPAASDEQGPFDLALVAERLGGALVLRRTLPLRVAYALARVVSCEQPRWLARAIDA